MARPRARRARRVAAPAGPSHLAGVAALVGGAAWTAVALAVVLAARPARLARILHGWLPLAILAAVSLLVATLGVARSGCGPGGRLASPSLGGRGRLRRVDRRRSSATAAGLADSATLAIGQTLAMVGTAAVGVMVIGSGRT